MQIVQVELTETDVEIGEQLVSQFNKASQKHLVFFGFLQSCLSGGLKTTRPDEFTIILDNLQWLLDVSRDALVHGMDLEDYMLKVTKNES